ncbi:MAG: WG repeat-containing protein [Planctomycetota bacterium]|jgi:predicted esterase
MSEKLYLGLLAACLVCLTGLGAVYGQDDVGDVPCEKLTAGGDDNKQYFLIGAYEGVRAPEEGFGLVIVIPGGDGGADFNPFVKRIYKKALSWEYVVAELVAVKWTSEQEVVWPTARNAVGKQKFSTEEFIEAVIEDVRGKCKLNNDHIFTLSWSSGGPAAYACSLQEKKLVTGSFIAMSVFKPQTLPALEGGKDQAYVLYHSPVDKVCPFQMTAEAEKKLSGVGAKVKVSKYAGGHGWPSAPYSRMRFGIKWLEKNHGAPVQAAEPDELNAVSEANAPPQANSVEQGLPTVPLEAGEHLFMIREGRKFGYMNNKGQMVIKPQFDTAFNFSDGMARVTVEGKVGYIDTSGEVKFFIEAGLFSSGDFSEGLARAMAPDSRSGMRKMKWGYIDKTGKFVIQARYYGAANFSEGRALVELGESYGFIDKTGKMVIPNIYAYGSSFSEGLAFVQGPYAGGRCGYLDPNGTYGVEPRYGVGKRFSEGLAAVRKRATAGLYGYIDRTGKYIIEPKFDDALSFSDGLAAIKIGVNPYGTGGNWGYIDKTGKIVIKPKFRKASSFSDGLAAVSNGIQYGYIDKTGRKVMDYQFDSAGGFTHGLARVGISGGTGGGGKVGYIDKTGNFVWQLSE